MSDLIKQNTVPGGTGRNLKAYGHHIQVADDLDEKNVLNILADPQTSGGLLIAVDAHAINQLSEIFKEFGLENFLQPIGKLIAAKSSGTYLLQIIADGKIMDSQKISCVK